MIDFSEDNSTEFSSLLQQHRLAVERYINYRMSCTHDADDVIQNTFLAAYRSFDSLRDRSAFRAWLLSIAKNECRLFWRRMEKNQYIPMDKAGEPRYLEPFDRISRTGEMVHQTMTLLPPENAQVLKLYYFGGKNQREIGELLHIPEGTVKSRLYYAKKKFAGLYPCDSYYKYHKGDTEMKQNNMTEDHWFKGHRFPSVMPEIKIEKNAAPFSELRIEEYAFITARVGNVSIQADYTYPGGELFRISRTHVPKEAVVHDIPCVKVCRDTYNLRNNVLHTNERIWFIQMTEEYIRDLGMIVSDGEDGDPTCITTFLDDSYNIIVNGEDTVHGCPVVLKENPIVQTEDGYAMELYNLRYTTGMWNVTIGGRQFETVGYIHVEANSPKSDPIWAQELYHDRAGKTVLMRCYDAEAWMDEETRSRYAGNRRIVINGMTYIHTEDRFSDYVL